MSFAYTALAVAIIGAATSIGFGIASARNQRKAARAQLEATAMQAKNKAKERAKQIRRMAAHNKSSFVHSGIALTGEGTTDDVISGTFDTGIADLENITQNAAVQGKNIEYQTRSNLMKTYGQMASDVSSYASMGLRGAGSKGTTPSVESSGSMSSGMQGMGSFGSDFQSFGGGTMSPGSNGSMSNMNISYRGGS